MSATNAADRRFRLGFTLTELLVVIGVIVVLLGLLLPALGGVWRGGQLVRSTSNLHQIWLWMQQYSGDNRETILPSQFDYSYPGCPDCYRGKVRSGTVAIGDKHQGTWADILWTINGLNTVGSLAAANAGGAGGLGQGTAPDYLTDSPDYLFYKQVGGYDKNVLRSAAVNTRNAPASHGTPMATPFGAGAEEAGEPGYFAANNFFNADPDSPSHNGWFARGQIAFPDQALYLVDSFYGETIEPTCAAFSNPGLDLEGTLEVDFRYSGVCLMLFLDGHIDQQSPWFCLDNLQGREGRGVRVQDLDERRPPEPCPDCP